ncbi:malonate decarboxylase holo-ACP synthase [Massilia sp. GCM10023247]|uniref:malonate decarboxylase holo-ACP synthase n=1 Tax=Massilia sp. GCM10023247 TaxID=3252643 RepID=UPI00361D4804
MQAATTGRPASGFRPHDLLWVGDWDAFQAEGDVPAWVRAAQDRGSPVVVRRARTGSPALLPVGLRGSTRSERLGGQLQRAAVLAHASPEALLHSPARRVLLASGAGPILDALDRIAAPLAEAGLAWGPTGSLGFALATGWPVLHEASDIDLLVRVPLPLSASQAGLLRAACDAGAWRVDLQVDTGRGGFSFAEWTRNGGRVLLKTDAGPRMTDHPWHPAGPLGITGEDAA